MSFHYSPCTFPGCGRVIRSRGLCEGHQKQQRRGRALAPINDAISTAHTAKHRAEKDAASWIEQLKARKSAR